jgi:hypothetical protein
MATKENRELTKEKKESMNRLKACLKSIILLPSPPTVLNTIDTPISTHSEYKENNSSRSFSSSYSGGYYSYGENLNGGGSSEFSQNGGGHHNFYGRVDRLR